MRHRPKAKTKNDRRRLPGAGAGPSASKTRVAIALLMVTTLVVFQVVRKFDFIALDDAENVFQNPHLLLPPLSATAFFWSHPYFASFIPLTRSVWVGLWSLSHEPGPFHLANLALHLVNVLLVFALLRKLAFQSLAAGAGALLFAIHPVQVEPVAWVTGLKDVLGGFFALLALLWYVDYAKAIDDSSPGGKKLPSLAIATAWFVCALLCKASMAMVPVSAAILAVAAGRSIRAAWPSFALWIGLVLPFMLLSRYSERLEITQYAQTSAADRVMIAGDAIAFYLGKVIAPFHLAPDYGRIPALVLARPWVGLLGILLVVLGVGAFFVGRWRNPLGVAFALFVAGILPVLGLVSFIHQNISTVADRYLYLAMLGPAFLVTYVIDKQARVAVHVVATAAFLVLAGLAFAQVRHWRNTETVFRHTLAVNPRSWVAHVNLGSVLEVRGDLREAEEHYRAAVLLRPDTKEAHYNLGATLGKEGKTAEAIEHLQEAIRLSPDYAKAHNQLGHMLYVEGYPDSAIQEMRIVVQLLPENGEAHRILGQVLATRGRIDEARTQLSEAVRLNPDDATARKALETLGGNSAR